MRRLAALFGVDPAGFRTLCGVFRVLARRNVAALLAARAAPAPERRVVHAITLGLLLFLVGALLAVQLLLGPVGHGTVGFLTAVMILAGFVVVAELAVVLAAPEDDDVLFALPVDSRTYLAARLAVAARRAVLLVVGLVAVGCFVLGVRGRGVGPAAGLLVAAVGEALLAVVLGFLGYRVVLRGLGTRRLRQALLMLPAVGALAPALMATTPVVSAALVPTGGTSSPWRWAWPPTWYAGFVDLGFGEGADAAARAAVGVVAVVAGLVLLVRVLGRRTVERLQAAAVAHAAAPRTTRRPGPGRWARLLFGVRSADARAGWLLARAAMRAPGWRARALPQVLVPVIWVVGFARGPASSEAAVYVDATLVLLLAAHVPPLVGQLAHGHPPDGAWVYEALPFRRYPRFHLGALRALLAAWVVPTWALVAVAGAVRGLSPDRIPTFACAVGLCLLNVAVTAVLERDRLPFSERHRPGRAEARVGTVLIGLVVALAGTAFSVVARLLVGPLGQAAAGVALGAVAAVVFAELAVRLETVPPPGLRPIDTSAVGAPDRG